MGELRWSIELAPSAADLAVVERGVVDDARARAGVGAPQPLACFVRDGDVLVAGVTGRVEFARLFVSWLWVAEERRGRGLGGALLARIEREARDLGCADALIETLSDPVAERFRRAGYAPLATIRDYIPGFTRHVLLKRLDA